MRFPQSFYPYISRLVDRMRGTHAEEAYQLLLRSQWMKAENIRKLQMEKLRKLIVHASRSVPYYRDLFRKIGMVPEDIRKIEDLNRIPILTKHIIRQRFSDLTIDLHSVKGVSIYSTNGSTGKPLQFYKDSSTKSMSIAAQRRSWEWAGYTVGDRVATIWGNRVFIAETRRLKRKIKNWIYNTELFPACHLTDDYEFGRAIDDMISFKPEILFGYTQTLYLLAAYMRTYGIKSIRPRAVITTAETLSDAQRKVIEEQFDCYVFDQYGCGEVESIAYECEAHQEYHVIDEHVIVEILCEDGSRADPGQCGSIVVTDLDNYAMPFIRYRNGDVAKVALSNLCSCGRGLAKIGEIEGRESDVISTPDGRVLSLPSFYGTDILDAIGGIEQFQIVQENISELKVRLVTTKAFTEAGLNRLYSITQDQVGSRMKISIEKVPRIEPEPNGKIKLVKSALTVEQTRSS